MTDTISYGGSISELQDKIVRTVKPTVDVSEGFALLDFPNYSNVGDSLIWLGALEFFQSQFSVIPSYVCTRDGYDAEALAKNCPKGPIFLSGGGNFGDVWPKFQRFRDRVLNDFKDRLIVQLPQTIHYADLRNAESTRSAMNGSQFVLFVRDRKSYQTATDIFNCQVELCPDMAFMIGGLTINVKKPKEFMFLLRNDLETLENRGKIPFDASSFVEDDWLDDNASTLLLNRLPMALVGRSSGLPGGQRRMFEMFKLLAKLRMTRGLKTLAQGKYVVTDRLHAHILCILMNKTHCVIDNAYGKISGFVDAWTAGNPLVNRSDNISAAYNMLRSIDRN